MPRKAASTIRARTMASPTRLDRDGAQLAQHQTNINRMNINSSSLEVDENTVLKGLQLLLYETMPQG